MRPLIRTAVLSLFFVPVLAYAESMASKPTPVLPPIKEVTVFKDGHAFVLHEGKAPVGEDGSVTLDYLPMPVLGTFWPYSADKDVRLKSVTAGEQKVDKQEAVLEILELLQANVGGEVQIALSPLGTQPPENFAATIVSVPTPPERESTGGGELASPPPIPGTMPRPRVVLVKTSAGTRAIPPERIIEVTFPHDYKNTLTRKTSRNRLRLELGWPGQPSQEANIGMVYLQKGLRWIPNYKIDLDDEGHAAVKLQATLINELADLDDVTVHLVIGVPSFAFQDTFDPIALQKAAAQVAARTPNDYRMSNAFSNAIMSQQVRYSESRVRADEPSGSSDLGPEIGTQKGEDLFVFSIRGIHLKKGERMVVPVAEFTLNYTDFHKLDLPFSPPREMRTNLDSARQIELAKLLASAKVTHHIRLQNKSTFPLTTAPALVLEKGRILCQTLMTYASIGAESDLELTTAVGVTYEKEEKESKRTPNAGKWRGNDYMRIDLAGTLTLCNHTSKAVDVEITRRVLGIADTADHDGKVQMTNALEDSDFTSRPPEWWSTFNWPAYWLDLNGLGRFSWKLHLEPQGKEMVHYEWHYFHGS